MTWRVTSSVVLRAQPASSQIFSELKQMPHRDRRLIVVEMPPQAADAARNMGCFDSVRLAPHFAQHDRMGKPLFFDHPSVSANPLRVLTKPRSCTQTQSAADAEAYCG